MVRTIKADQARLFREYPDAESAECGHCRRTFPDVFPAGRCPFEVRHAYGIDIRGRVRKFDTLDDAKNASERIYQRSGVIVGIFTV